MSSLDGDEEGPPGVKDELDPTTSEESTESEGEAESDDEETETSQGAEGKTEEKDTEPCHALVPVAKTTEDKAIELKNSA